MIGAMPDEISKKYIIAIVLVVLVAAIAAAGFGIWRISKKSQEEEEKMRARQAAEELLRNISAPKETEKNPVNQKILDSLSAPKRPQPSYQPSKEILNSLTAPSQ